MKIDPMGLALSTLTRFAGSDAAERLHLRAPAEKLAHRVTRDGLRTATAAARQLQSVTRLLRPERPARPSRGSDLFDLTPTDDQEMFRDSARRFAESSLRPAAADADEAAAPPATILDGSAELGLAMLAVPEALGGAGGERSPVTNVLVAEELARGDMGLAVATLAPVGVATALAQWGSAGQQSRYLPAFAEGVVPSAIAIAEPEPLFDPRTLRCRAHRVEGGFVLNGEKALIPLVESAELLLVVAELDTTGPQVFVVRRDAPGLTLRSQPGMGVRAAALGHAVFADVRLGADDILGGAVGAVDVRELIDLARIGWCALAVGTAQAVLEYVIEYGNERMAFGEPITHRQSVAFLIADLRIEIDAMRLLTYRAAGRAEEGLSFHREAYLARTLCAEKAMQVGTNGVQLLGGHGYIKEHPVERWYRDLRAVALMEGGVLV